jgi:hypothetical protein
VKPPGYWKWRGHGRGGREVRLLEIVVAQHHLGGPQRPFAAETEERLRAGPAALTRREHHGRHPLLRGERARIIGEDELMAVTRVQEEIEDALFLQDAMDKIQLRLAVLAEEFARRVRLPEAPRDVLIDAGVLEHLFHDVDGALALEDPRPLPVLQRREGRAEPDMEHEFIPAVREEPHAIGEAVVVADAALRVVDLEHHPPAQAVVDAERGVARAELDLDLVREGDPLAGAVAVDPDVSGEGIAKKGQVTRHGCSS